MPSLRARMQVPHVVGEHAVLDEHVPLGGVTFVVEAERAPLSGHRAIVDERDVLGRDLLTDLAGVDAGALGDGIGLQSVAAGLVEQHAATPPLDDDGHRSRRRRSGRQFGRRHARCVAGESLDVDAVERLETDGVADRLKPCLHPRVAVGDHVDPGHRPGDRVRREHSVGVGDEDVLTAVGIRRRHLDHRLARRPSGFVDAPEQLDLGGLRHAARVDLDLVDPMPLGGTERHRGGTALAVARRCRGSLGCGGQATLGEVARVGVAGGFAGQHAHTSAAVATAVDLLDAPVVEARRGRALVFGVDLGEVAAGPHRRRQHALEDVVVDHPSDAIGMRRFAGDSPATRLLVAPCDVGRPRRSCRTKQARPVRETAQSARTCRTWS